MSAHDIVSRLDHCRQSGDGKWIARCPAHQDNGPSLTIADKGDGRTLIHCFAGCGALDVLTALGLDWSDLYPPKQESYLGSVTRRERTIDELVVEIATADMRAGKELSRDDRERCREALLRLDKGEQGPRCEPLQAQRNALEVGREYSERTAQRMAVLSGDQ
tara:strand:+ start:10221 stop:10706 length:486 start_codon:yes stop_codon:yes gene_type:complete